MTEISDGSTLKTRAHELVDRTEVLRQEIAKSIIGQEELVEHLLLALFSGGHVLLEGLPGLGKTLLVKTLAKCLGLESSRIQFTPDLMPADVTECALVPCMSLVDVAPSESS
jgi:MoxR-like ATPase